MAEYSEQNISPQMMHRGSTVKSQQGYDKAMVSMLIDREVDRKSVDMKKKDKINFGTILKMEKIYKLNLFSRWLQLSKSHYEKSFEQKSNAMKSIREASEIGSKSKKSAMKEDSMSRKSFPNKSSIRSSPSKHSRRPATVSFHQI